MNQPTKQPTHPPDLLDSKLVVLATVRDCATTLQSDISNLQTALGLFKNVHWFIVESDSTDDTLKVLKDLKESVPNFEFIGLGKLEPQLKLRTERIAHCRNRYLEELDKNPSLVDANLCVIADLDGTQSLLTQEGLMSCFKRGDWGVCCSNQQGLYYDVWALRHPVWSPNDCWEAAFFLQAMGVEPDKARFGAAFSRMLEIPTESEWIEVDSAFGGLAIYKREYIGTSRYLGTLKTGAWGGQTCEHVFFHAALKSNGARIYINPALINTDLNQHSLASIVPGNLDPLNIAETPTDGKEQKISQLDVMHTTVEDIVAAYKIFLSRQPESLNVVYPRVGMTTDMVLIDFLGSEEFLKRKDAHKIIGLMLTKLKELHN